MVERILNLGIILSFYLVVFIIDTTIDYFKSKRKSVLFGEIWGCPHCKDTYLKNIENCAECGGELQVLGFEEI